MNPLVKVIGITGILAGSVGGLVGSVIPSEREVTVEVNRQTTVNTVVVKKDYMDAYETCIQYSDRHDESIPQCRAVASEAAYGRK